jgi:hypothetical protein
MKYIYLMGLLIEIAVLIMVIKTVKRGNKSKGKDNLSIR